AIIQALIAMLTRSAGKLLNTAFSWATILLFGRVSQDRQIYVSLIAFGSVIWLIVLAGVAFPSVATFLLSFVTLPKWIDKTWIRLAMLAAVVVIPAVIGAVTNIMLDKAKRPRGAAAVATAVLKGYPYTVGFALTLATMTVFAPILKVRTLAKRWTTEHVPVIVEPRDYEAVVESVRAALAEGGFATTRDRASWRLRELEVPYEEWEVLFRQLLLLERALREGGRSVSAGPDWAATLGAGVAIAAPHAEKIADAVGETVKELRETAHRAPRTVPVLSAVAAAVAALAAFVALPWRRRTRHGGGESTRRSRRAA